MYYNLAACYIKVIMLLCSLLYTIPSRAMCFISIANALFQTGKTFSASLSLWSSSRYQRSLHQGHKAPCNPAGAAAEGRDRGHRLQLLHGRGSPRGGAEDPRLRHHAVVLLLQPPADLQRLRSHGHLVRRHHSRLPEARRAPGPRERIPLPGRVGARTLHLSRKDCVASFWKLCSVTNENIG